MRWGLILSWAKDMLSTLREFREYANYIFGRREVNKPFRDDFSRLESIADDAGLVGCGGPKCVAILPIRRVPRPLVFSSQSLGVQLERLKVLVSDPFPKREQIDPVAHHVRDKRISEPVQSHIRHSGAFA